MKARMIQNNIASYCKRNGISYNKNIVSSKNGEPDLKIILNGQTYYFEVKGKGDKMRNHQIEKIKKYNNAKEIAFVIENYKQFLATIAKIILKGE